jgi:hypothetical protein
VALIDYKKRLATVRSELLDIDENCSPVVTSEEPEPIKSIALGVCRIARILIRVIDSIPG